jgi:hypothetical protein
MKPIEEMSLSEFAEKIASVLVTRYGKTPDEAIAFLRARKGDVAAWYRQDGDDCIAASAAKTMQQASLVEPKLKTPTSTVLAASAPEKVYGAIPRPIIVAASEFPRLFGLRSFPGDLFRISMESSFVDNGKIPLFTQRFDRRESEWEDFAKGSPVELEREVVDAPEWFPQKSPAR